jgi:SAM-dependent methyltransferase
MRLGTLMSRSFQVLPAPLKPVAQSAFLLALQASHRGSRVHCPCCERDFRAFCDPPISPWPQMCPGCGSLARHRAMWLYIARESDLVSAPRRLLHVSPEPSIARQLRRLTQLDYVSIDIEPGKAILTMDLSDLKFADASFDAIICSHVLEHVDDDRRAIAEVARVLRPQGWAILQVPIHPDLISTLEDASIADAKERELRFGQWDHVRVYGRDYADRLEAAGLHLTLLDYAGSLGSELTLRYGLDAQDPLCVVYKVPRGE